MRKPFRGRTRRAVLALTAAVAGLVGPIADTAAAESDRGFRYPAAFLCAGIVGEPTPDDAVRDTTVIMANPNDHVAELEIAVIGDTVITLRHRLAPAERLVLNCSGVLPGMDMVGFMNIRSADPIDVVATYWSSVDGFSPEDATDAAMVVSVTFVAQLEQVPRSDIEQNALAALGIEHRTPVTLMTFTVASSDSVLDPAEAAQQTLEVSLSRELERAGLATADAAQAAHRITAEEMQIWIEVVDTDIALGGNAISIDVLPIAAVTPATTSNAQCCEGTQECGSRCCAETSTCETACCDGTASCSTTCCGGPGAGCGSGSVDSGGGSGPVTVNLSTTDGWTAGWWWPVIAAVLFGALIATVVGLLILLFWNFRSRRETRSGPDESVDAPHYEMSCALRREREIDVDDREAELVITVELIAPMSDIRIARHACLTLVFDFVGKRITFDGEAAGELTFNLPDLEPDRAVTQVVTVATGFFTAPDSEAVSADAGVYTFAATASSTPVPKLRRLRRIVGTDLLTFRVAHD